MLRCYVDGTIRMQRYGVVSWGDLSRLRVSRGLETPSISHPPASTPRPAFPIAVWGLVAHAPRKSKRAPRALVPEFLTGDCVLAAVGERGVQRGAHPAALPDQSRRVGHPGRVGAKKWSKTGWKSRVEKNESKKKEKRKRCERVRTDRGRFGVGLDEEEQEGALFDLRRCSL